MVLVQFTRQWRNYNDGEVSGWDEDFAKRLVDIGVAAYVKTAEGEETPPPGDDHSGELKGLTKTAFMRLTADELIALATEKGIDLGGATLKKDTQPILKAVLFPESVKEDENE